MNIEKAKKHIETHLEQEDSLLGFFYAQLPLKIWLYLFIGPLALFAIKYYYVAVTKNGIHFHQLSMFGNFKNGGEFFTFDEIKSVKIGNGILRRPMLFLFHNGQKLEVKAQLKGVGKVAKITEVVQEHIQTNVNQTEPNVNQIDKRYEDGGFCLDCDLDLTQVELEKNNYRCPQCHAEI